MNVFELRIETFPDDDDDPNQDTRHLVPEDVSGHRLVELITPRLSQKDQKWADGIATALIILASGKASVESDDNNPCCIRIDEDDGQTCFTLTRKKVE